MAYFPKGDIVFARRQQRHDPMRYARGTPNYTRITTHAETQKNHTTQKHTTNTKYTNIKRLTFLLLHLCFIDMAMGKEMVCVLYFHLICVALFDMNTLGIALLSAAFACLSLALSAFSV